MIFFFPLRFLSSFFRLYTDPEAQVQIAEVYLRNFSFSLFWSDSIANANLKIATKSMTCWLFVVVFSFAFVVFGILVGMYFVHGFRFGFFIGLGFFSRITSVGKIRRAFYSSTIARIKLR